MTVAFNLGIREGNWKIALYILHFSERMSRVSCLLEIEKNDLHQAVSSYFLSKHVTKKDAETFASASFLVVFMEAFCFIFRESNETMSRKFMSQNVDRSAF